MSKADWTSADGAITLYRGDCLDVMPLLEETVDAIICDLPYGTTQCAWDTVIPFPALWVSYKRVIKKNGAIVLFGSQPFTSALVMSNPKLFRYEIIWDKVNRYTGHLSSAKIPMKRHENMMVFYDSIPAYNKQFRTGPAFPASSRNGKNGSHLSGADTGMRFNKGNTGDQHNPCSILPIKAKVNAATLHPTQKPVALIEYLIKTYTNEGETVLDNTFGSGTAAIACLNTNRKFIGIERDPTYFAAAVERIQSHIENRVEPLFTLDTPAPSRPIPTQDMFSEEAA